MKKKKVLFITNWYPNSSSLNLGVFIKRHAESINLIAELTTAAITISSSNKIFEKQVHQSKNESVGHLIHIEIKSKLWKLITYMPYYQYRLIKKELKKIDHFEFDLVQSNVLFAAGLIGARFSRKLNISHVHVEHWSGISDFLKKSIYKRQGYNALKKASAIVCVSDFFKNDISQTIPNDNIHVIPNVISDDFQVSVKKESNNIRFLAVAHWSFPKKPSLFLNALSALAKTGLTFELTFIGSGELQEQIIEEDFPFKILFLGDIKNKDLVSYYQEAEVFLHASSYETFSVVPIESLLTGTPVVASKVGVLPEIINEDNGVLCNDTLEDWISGIQKVVNTKYDVEKVRKSVEGKFSMETVSNKFNELYQSL